MRDETAGEKCQSGRSSEAVGVEIDVNVTGGDILQNQVNITVSVRIVHLTRRDKTTPSKPGHNSAIRSQGIKTVIENLKENQSVGRLFATVEIPVPVDIEIKSIGRHRGAIIKDHVGKSGALDRVAGLEGYIIILGRIKTVDRGGLFSGG